MRDAFTVAAATLLALAGAGAGAGAGAASQSSDRSSEGVVFTHSQSAGHTVALSPPEVSSKWVLFPEQHELHTQATKSKQDGRSGSGSRDRESVRDSTRMVSVESFWREHSEAAGVSASTEMKLKKSSVSSSSSSSFSSSSSAKSGSNEMLKTYDQVVDGVRVFGGEFRVTIGAHGGVVNAHGLPFRSASKYPYDISKKEEIISRSVDDEALQQQLYEAVEQHIYRTQGQVMSVQSLVRDPISNDSRRPELVWFSRDSVRGDMQDGSWTLTYYLRGVRVSASPVAPRAGMIRNSNIDVSELKHPKDTGKVIQELMCDVFIDASTLVVVDFVDKSTRYSTPFVNPLGRNVEVTDFPTQNIIFNDTSTFPTADDEMDLLITTTMYVSNIMYSISGGSYHTWAGADVKLNIETNLAIANAYFDGDWGIHFGTGYITDDVIGHEWGHGYMDTATDSIYQYQPGAMDEAFADILGETIDILNGDTNDVSTPRTDTSSIPPCTVERGGTDVGNRWSMGEDVTGGSGGSIRDMYSPTCHYHGDTTYSPYYYCGSSDSGGVHWNSGVVNRLYAVLVDGGTYAEVPGSETGPVPISPIGMTKSINLFWSAYQQLTPTAQFFDLAAALNQSCTFLVGGDIYEPNLLDTTLTLSSDLITTADCVEVEKALVQSGMARTDVCQAEDLVKSACSSGAAPEDSVVNEAYSKYLADYYYVLFGCGNAVNGVTYRVFDYDTLGLATTSNPLAFVLECIEFAYLLDSGSASFTIKVFIDSSGGIPDFASMTQVGSDMPASVSFNTGETELTSVTPAEAILITLPSTSASVVVALTVDTKPSEGYFWGRGRYNPSAVGTHKETFLSGQCYGGGGYINTATFFNAAFGTSYMDNYQWYVHMTKSALPVSLSPTMVPSESPTIHSADVPTHVPTIVSSLQPTVEAGTVFSLQVVELGRLTTIAARRNKDEWMSDAAYICPEDLLNQKRFSILSLKSVIQSPGTEVMNLVVNVQHRKLSFSPEKAFVSLKIVRKVESTADVIVFESDQNMFTESSLLTHFIPPFNSTTGAVVGNIKLGLQVNFTAAKISPMDNMYEARIAVGIRDDVTDTDPAEYEVYDCVYIKNSGVISVV